MMMHFCHFFYFISAKMHIFLRQSKSILCILALQTKLNTKYNMALIKSVRGVTPKIGKNCYFSENATVVGDVIIGDDCSVWFNAVIRGDVNSIAIGNKVNVQDGAVLHTLYQKSKIKIGNNVSIGHNVTIHGATIKDYVLVGMGATILDDAVVSENTIIAANSLVRSGEILEPNSIYAGVPAKKVKDIDPEQTREMIIGISENYLMYSGWYKEDGDSSAEIKE